MFTLNSMANVAKEQHLDRLKAAETARLLSEASPAEAQDGLIARIIESKFFRFIRHEVDERRPVLNRSSSKV